jgi:hypothetical protein
MASPTEITIDSDNDEYSRFESDRKILGYTVSVTGTSLTNELITIELVKARRNRDVVVAYNTLSLTEDTDGVYNGSFDLTKVVDIQEISKVRRGEYFLRATSVSDEDVVGESSDFKISLITVNRLKNDYLFGIDLRAEMLGPLEQPKVITGVTIFEVSKDHTQDWITLGYTIASDGGGGFIRTLSWCGGPQVKIVSGTHNYVLRKGNSADWIRVKVSSVLDLPSSSTVEDILITSKEFDDNKFRTIIDQSISWLEDMELFIFLEPTLVTTQPDLGVVPNESSIPVFVGADWDEVVNAVTYKAPSSGHWINFQLPYKPLIRFNSLYGIVSSARVLDMNLEWVKTHERSGFVELMPFNQSSAFNFLGLSWVQSIRGAIDLPNFWNFEALCGFRDLPPILLEIIAKKAAIDILTFVGTAKRAGIASQSISRDGVSESVSYTASATSTIYSATIGEYKKFIEENIRHFKGAFSGVRMTVV